MKTTTAPQVRRGLIGGARADATPAEILAKLNNAFEEYKTKNDEQLAEIKKGVKDAVRTEEIARIDTSITDLQKALNESLAKMQAIETGGAGNAAGDKRTPEQKAYDEAFGKYFRKGGDENALREMEVKAAATRQTDEDGGFTVTTETETAIDRVLTNYSAMRSLSTVRRIGGASYKKLVGLGGTTSGWVGETEGRPQTDVSKLSELAFPAMELYAMPAATQSLLDDSGLDIAAWLADEVSIEFADQEGNAFVNGNGNKKPAGFLGATKKVDNASYAWGKIGFVTSGASGGFHADTPADAVINLIYSLKRGYRQNGAFLLNDMTMSTVRKWKDSEDNYMWQPSLQLGQPAMLAGYRVETDDYMPDVGADAFPIAFGDFRRAYLIVDRIGVRVLRDPYSAKPYVLFYTTKRVGGGVQNFEALKLLKIAQ